MFRRSKKSKATEVESGDLSLSKSERKAAARALHRQQRNDRYPGRSSKSTPFPDRARQGPALSLEFIGELKRRTEALRVLELDDDSDSEDDDEEKQVEESASGARLQDPSSPGPGNEVAIMNTTPTGRRARWRVLRRASIGRKSGRSLAPKRETAPKSTKSTRSRLLLFPLSNKDKDKDGPSSSRRRANTSSMDRPSSLTSRQMVDESSDSSVAGSQTTRKKKFLFGMLQLKSTDKSGALSENEALTSGQTVTSEPHIPESPSHAERISSSMPSPSSLGARQRRNSDPTLKSPRSGSSFVTDDPPRKAVFVSPKKTTPQATPNSRRLARPRALSSMSPSSGGSGSPLYHHLPPPIAGSLPSQSSMLARTPDRSPLLTAPLPPPISPEEAALHLSRGNSPTPPHLLLSGDQLSKAAADRLAAATLPLPLTPMGAHTRTGAAPPQQQQSAARISPESSVAAADDDQPSRPSPVLVRTNTEDLLPSVAGEKNQRHSLRRALFQPAAIVDRTASSASAAESGASPSPSPSPSPPPASPPPVSASQPPISFPSILVAPSVPSSDTKTATATASPVNWTTDPAECSLPGDTDDLASDGADHMRTRTPAAEAHSRTLQDSELRATSPDNEQGSLTDEEGTASSDELRSPANDQQRSFAEKSSPLNTSVEQTSRDSLALELGIDLSELSVDNTFAACAGTHDLRGALAASLGIEMDSCEEYSDESPYVSDYSSSYTRSASATLLQPLGSQNYDQAKFDPGDEAFSLKGKSLEIFEELGKGAQATVWKGAIDGALVALKQVSFASVNDKHQLKRELRAEVALVRSLVHRNILRYYGSFYSRKREEMNLVVEIVLGGSLTDYIRAYGSFSDVVCAHVLHQLLEGLHFLHSNDILHRDIKPDNLLVDLDGVIKLVDFGLSAKLQGASRSRNSSVGTPWYTAPEVIDGEEYSESCDIWSVGCTLVEMTSGRSPYRELNAMATLMRMSEDAHPPIPDSCSDACEAFLLRCWAKPQSLRPSAHQLQSDPFVCDLLIEGHHECVLQKALPTPRVSSVFDLSGLADF